MMRVLVGCFYHETNTFNPQPTTIDDFVVVEGAEVLERVQSTNVFKENNVEVVPSIYASGLSSGIVEKKTFETLLNKIVSILKTDTKIDGIWLHLHGSMIVEGIGSGELALIKEIRSYIKENLPISLTLDIHGNIPKELSEHVNIVRSYRTVPHIDQSETERITAQALVDYMKDELEVKPAFTTLPLIICGEKALGKSEPLRSIFNELERLEKNPGILTASFFLGHAWSDSVNTGASIFVVPKSREYEKLAKDTCLELKEFIYEKRDEFDFDALTLSPKEAVEYALNKNIKPIFISDSGDNTTAGAPGYNTVLLKELQSQDIGNKKVLIASIFDENAFKILTDNNVGDRISIKVGGNHDVDSELTLIEGTIKAKGDLLGYLNAANDKVGEVCTISSGNLDVVIANRGDSFISLNHFKRAGLDFEAYDLIVLKQGYLFDELSKVSGLDILAMSPGATFLRIKDLQYKNIAENMQLI